jgi:hypothetical protein
MFLRNEVNDRLIITADYAHIRNIYETCIYEITESGLLWLSGRYRVGTEKATRLHEATIRKIETEGKPNPLCRCGQVARQYSNIARAWLCATCYAIDVEDGR